MATEREETAMADLPDFDTVESVGLDGTLRTGDGRPHTWPEVVAAAQSQSDLLATLLANVGGWELQQVGGNVECRVAEYRDPTDPTQVVVFVVGPGPDYDCWGLYTRAAWYDGNDPKTGTESFASGRIV